MLTAIKCRCHVVDIRHALCKNLEGVLHSGNDRWASGIKVLVLQRIVPHTHARTRTRTTGGNIVSRRTQLAQL
jgi:hemolysin-activating ACP:hemolysin acyltransferase